MLTDDLKNFYAYFQVVKGLDLAYGEHLTNKGIESKCILGINLLSYDQSIYYLKLIENNNGNIFILHIKGPSENTKKWFKENYELFEDKTINPGNDMYCLRTENLDSLKSLLKLQGYLK